SLPLENLIQFGCVDFQFAAARHVKAHGNKGSSDAIDLTDNQVRRVVVAEALIVCEAASKQKCMHPRSPFVMIATNQDGVLELIIEEVRSGVALIEVLEIIAGVVVLVFG